MDGWMDRWMDKILDKHFDNQLIWTDTNCRRRPLQISKFLFAPLSMSAFISCLIDFSGRKSMTQIDMCRSTRHLINVPPPYYTYKGFHMVWLVVIVVTLERWCFSFVWCSPRLTCYVFVFLIVIVFSRPKTSRTYTFIQHRHTMWWLAAHRNCKFPYLCLNL